MKQFLKSNGLSIVFIILFLLSLGGQVYFGFKEHNCRITARSFRNYYYRYLSFFRDISAIDFRELGKRIPSDGFICCSNDLASSEGII
jgi:hypothetical protein